MFGASSELSSVMEFGFNLAYKTAANRSRETRKCTASSGHRRFSYDVRLCARSTILKRQLAALIDNELNNLAPPYLSDDCQLVATTGRRQFRSSDNFKYTITSTTVVHVLEIEHSLLPDHAFGTVFLHMSVDLICPWTPSAGN